MKGRLFLLGVLFVSAGCIGLGDDAEAGSSEARQGGVGPQPSVGLVNVSTTEPGTEPVVGVTASGYTFVQGIGITTGVSPENVHSGAPSHVWRSPPDKDTYERVDPPDFGSNGTGDGFVAVGHDETVYAANAYAPRAGFVFTPVGGERAGAPGKMQMFRSDDLGDSWDRLEVPPIPGSIHRMWVVPAGDETLHVTVATEGPTFDTQPLWYLRSDDRGGSWTEPEPIHDRRSFGTDLGVGPDGELYIAIWGAREDPDWLLLRSTDGGETWSSTPAGVAGTRDGFASSWQSLEVDDAGNVYIVWVQQRTNDTRAYCTVSTDEGETWSEARPVDPEGGPQMLAWAEATGPGELAFSWYRAEGASSSNETTRWFPEIATIENATTANPGTSVHRTSKWPIHEGPICEAAVCSGGERRSDSWHLMDFTWVTQGPQDGLHGAFASTQWERDGGFPIVGSATFGG